MTMYEPSRFVYFEIKVWCFFYTTIHKILMMTRMVMMMMTTMTTGTIVLSNTVGHTPKYDNVPTL